MTRHYRFGVDKVHPAPALNPAVAPWSAPRGYTTSILEETNALKETNRLSKKVAGGPAAIRWRSPGRKKRQQIKTPNCFRAIAEHFRLVFRDFATNLRFNKSKFVAKLCCLQSEISA